ncbi:MAG: hypothetical protein DCF16_10570 [Alphaproteobacteria bacterium]|nr:MAG: hypothetical protein DCF16_10570 [Alphaproteobacteria bacterium]
MRKFLLSAAVAALLAACTPPAQQQEPDAPGPVPQVQACNTVTPDIARMVRIEEAGAVTAAVDLPGGPIAPGTYDLVRAVRVGQPTGWQGARSVALEVTEDASGVTFQWAGAPESGEVDRWTASFTDTPSPRLNFTCGRIGDVETDFTASRGALQLRVPDGANGSLLMDFARRG